MGASQELFAYKKDEVNDASSNFARTKQFVALILAWWLGVAILLRHCWPMLTCTLQVVVITLAHRGDRRVDPLVGGPSALKAMREAGGLGRVTNSLGF